jgi:uncharacterized damage-inducible protein DinB
MVESCIRLAERGELCDVRAAGVSAWSVGEQLEHLLLADRSILGAIEQLEDDNAAGGESDSSGGSPTWIGRFILWSGVVPRGRGRAPDSTTPTGMPIEELAAGLAALQDELETLRPQLDELEPIRATRAHPLLGNFTPKQWVRFASVHHMHHRKIIRDILRTG